MQLYNVGTFYELLNAIHIKMSLYPNEKADIILMDATDFSKQLAELRKMDIFENVYDGKNAWYIDRALKTTEIDERKRLLKKYYTEDCSDFTHKKYSDYFLGAQTPYFKLVYYALCENQIYPRVHLFEDGIYTYVLDFVNDCATDGFDHNSYGAHDIRKNIGSVFAYGEAEMYYGSEGFAYVQIPAFVLDKELFKKEKDIFRELWGECGLPKERFIFLEEGMFQDHLIAADTVLLEEIAQIVGKENIIVKRHPRCTHDRFSERGFKVLEQSGFPWELSLMNNEAEKYVLLSLSSTATTTGKTVLGKNIPAIQLYAMRPFGEAGPHCARKNFMAYAGALHAYMNQEDRIFFVPKSSDELNEALLFIEARCQNAE